MGEAPKADYVEIPLAAEMTDDDIDRAIRMHEGGRKGRGEVTHLNLKLYWDIMGIPMENIPWE